MLLGKAIVTASLGFECSPWLSIKDDLVKEDLFVMLERTSSL